MKAPAACHRWLADPDASAPRGTTITPVDVQSGQAIARRTGVSHYVTDAAEVVTPDGSWLAAVWLCGGSSVDTEAVTDSADQPDCGSCRLTASLPHGPCVYFAWDAETLLYVGSSINVPQRIRSHMTQTPWWDEVNRLTFSQHSTEMEARRAESRAIADRPGLYNREGTSRDRRRRTANVLDNIEVVLP